MTRHAGAAQSVPHLAVTLLSAGADLRVAVDDSVFRRAGRKVHAAGWQHDGSSPGMNKLSYGNCFVTAAIAVSLPFCSREVGLPVLARLHVPGKGNGPSKVEMAAALVTSLAFAFSKWLRSGACVGQAVGVSVIVCRCLRGGRAR